MASRPRPQSIKGKGVQVRGLDEFRKELLRVQREGGIRGYDLLKEHNYQVAEFVRVRAVARAQQAPNGKIQQRAAASLKSARRGDRAELIGGNDRKKPKSGNLGAALPFFGAAEFGTYQNVMRANVGGQPPRSGEGWNQFLPYKLPGGGHSGYFLFPTMRTYSDDIKEMYGAGLDRIMRQVFPD